MSSTFRPCEVLSDRILTLLSAEFYGPRLSTGNLEVLSRFYEKYPGYVDRTFLSVKVSVGQAKLN